MRERRMLGMILLLLIALIYVVYLLGPFSWNCDNYKKFDNQSYQNTYCDCWGMKVKNSGTADGLSYTTNCIGIVTNVRVEQGTNIF